MLPNDIAGSTRSARKHLMEDDNTFLPPALSSYSIALLNEKTTSTNPTTKVPAEITGIYDLDFPDTKSRNKLKDKLAVHFKEKHNDDNSYDNMYENSYHTPNHTSSYHNGSNPNSSHNLSNHNFSSNNSSNNINNINSPQTTTPNRHSLSQHNSFASQQSLSTIENKDTDIKNPSQGSSHVSGGSDRMPPVKRLRGARRFGKLLGPPQRASKVSAEPIVDSAPNLNKLPIFNDKHDKNHSHDLDLNLDFIDKEKELELRRRIEEQKQFNLMEHKNKSRSPTDINAYHNVSNASEEPHYSPHKGQRKPLEEVPQNNVHRFEPNFKMPRLPKPITPNRNSPRVEYQNNENFIQSAPEVPNKPSFDQNQYPAEQPPTLASLVALPPAVMQSIHSRKPEKSEGEKKKKTIGINGNQYEKLELLGRGGTSKVYRVKLLSNNRLYAIKKVTFDQFDDSCIRGFKGEIDLLLKLRESPRVVKLVDYAIGEGSIYLVMECGEIDLAHVFQNRLSSNETLDLNFVKFYSIEMLKCVEAVHKAEIVHSDLKPANFLFVKGILKIIDFGIANAVPDHTANIYRESQIGTPNYMAPEALIDTNQSLLPMKQSADQKNTWKVGKPSDVWSVGCIIYQMIYGKPPYGGYSGNQRIMAIMNPQVKIQYPAKGIGGLSVPQSAIDLMQNCLARIPNDRWTIEQCLNCDFLKPKVVSEAFIRDLVHLTVNFGYRNRVNGTGTISAEVYDRLVETVLKEIENLNFS